MQAVVLAAGESSRFWPLHAAGHKSGVRLLGKPLVIWTLEALARAGVTDVILVQGPSRALDALVAEAALGLDVRTVVQDEPRGMGDALWAARGHLAESFFLVHAHQIDADRWIGPMRAQEDPNASAVLAGCPTEHPDRYGMLALEGERVHGIVEKPAPEAAPSGVRVLGIYRLPRSLLDALEATADEPHAFEAALDRVLRAQPGRLVASEEPGPSLKYPWDLFSLAERLMDRDLGAHQAESAWVSPTAHLEGEVYVGAGARIFEFAVVKGPVYIGEDSVIGNHALVRDHVDLEAGTMIGAHAEVTRSVFQPGTSTHSGYFGDSVFDARARAGAGTVTANVKVDRSEVQARVQGTRTRTGRTGLGAIVGADTQLGINVSTLPGVLVGAGSFVEPGVVVGRNVADATRLRNDAEPVARPLRRRSH